MDVGAIVFVIFFIVLLAITRRNANENYTAGSGMFKRSDGNLKKDEHLDVSDYNYYDDEGKMK